MAGTFKDFVKSAFQRGASAAAAHSFGHWPIRHFLACLEETSENSPGTASRFVVPTLKEFGEPSVPLSPRGIELSWFPRWKGTFEKRRLCPFYHLRTAVSSPHNTN